MLRLIVIDPRPSELAAQADIWIKVRPGEDPTLLVGVTEADPGVKRGVVVALVGNGTHRSEGPRDGHTDPTASSTAKTGPTATPVGR